MACNETWLEILSAWHDGEATADEVARARAHLPACSACRVARSRFQLLGDALRALPPGVVREQRAGTNVIALAPRRRLRGRLLAAALVAAVAVGVLVQRGAHAGNEAVIDELEARHLTAFARASPCDFESADPAAVRAWIAEHFGREVEIPAVPGGRLLGARRCSLSGTTTVSLMYRRGDEPLSVFLSPSGTPTAAENVRLAGTKPGCTVGRLGATVCASPGIFAVAETRGTAIAALDPR